MIRWFLLVDYAFSNNFFWQLPFLMVIFAIFGASNSGIPRKFICLKDVIQLVFPNGWNTMVVVTENYFFIFTRNTHHSLRCRPSLDLAWTLGCSVHRDALFFWILVSPVAVKASKPMLNHLIWHSKLRIEAKRKKPQIVFLERYQCWFSCLIPCAVLYHTYPF